MVYNFRNLGGTVNGKWFEAADWVNKKKPPGYTSMGFVCVENSIKEILTLRNVLLSPNLIWLLIALISHVIFPYDIGAAKTFKVGWILTRIFVNVFVFIAYYGFWSVTVTFLQWSNRKYKPEYVPTTARMIHNIWYCTLGALQLALWEIIFLHMWATGKLSYVSDYEAMSTFSNIIWFAWWSLILPVLQDVHFYFIHRFIHIRPLYKYIHSLHHRNNDIEPFCGLSMHPVEHIYFFSILGLSVYLNMTPFHFRWILTWLMLAPGASHSGWEDHWNADQWHYLHHAKFECNYGSPGFPMDHVFGTARYSLDPNEKKYRGGATEKELVSEYNMAKINQKEKNYVPKHRWSSGGTIEPLDMIPRFHDGIFFAYCIIMLFVLVSSLGGLTLLPAHLVALMVSVGPCIVCVLLFKLSGDSLPLTWPFHKEAILGLFGVHFVVGFILSAAPVYSTILLALSDTKSSTG